MIRIFVLGMFVALSGAKVACAQLSMPYAERVELAKKLIAEDREAALANPADRTRATIFTKTNAQIDPVWTADFIISNPVEDRERLATENDTINILLANPGKLSSDQIKSLISYHPFMSQYYLKSALRNLGDDPKHEKLRRELSEIAFKELENLPANRLVLSVGNPLDLSHLPENPELVERLKQKIREFYFSGKAEETWQRIQNNRGAIAYNRSALIRNAPEGFDLSFLGKDESAAVDGMQVARVLNDASRAEEKKLQWLADQQSFDFGTESSMAQYHATQLGVVAQYDLEKAIMWAESAESPILTILGKLAVAPVLAKRDETAAIQLVRECYSNCLDIDLMAPENRGDMMLANTPPIRVAASALKIAEHIDSGLLAECVADTVKYIENAAVNSQSPASTDVYRAIAAIAAYDRKAGQKILDRIGEEVPLGFASEFFVALTAVSPEKVWEEYESLPPDENTSHQHRFRTRLAIAPALAKEDEADFFLALVGYHAISFPNSLFENDR